MIGLFCIHVSDHIYYNTCSSIYLGKNKKRKPNGGSSNPIVNQGNSSGTCSDNLEGKISGKTQTKTSRRVSGILEYHCHIGRMDSTFLFLSSPIHIIIFTV